jgi:hypothetical protein
MKKHDTYLHIYICIYIQINICDTFKIKFSKILQTTDYIQAAILT